MTKYYRDAGGRYLGAYDGPPAGNPFAGGVEVASPPADARATWNGAAWDEPAAEPEPLAPIEQLLIDKGVISRAELDAERAKR